jgi:hypothetical protein
VLVVLAAAACGGGDPGVNIGPPSRIEVALGADQQGVVGAPIPVPPAVRIVDANGRGVSGIAVTFAVAAGNGTVNNGDSLVTNADGIATVGEWRLGPQTGLQQLRAEAEGFTFQTLISATANPGPPASIQAITGGGALAAIVGQSVLFTPTVRVRDGFGNPIPGTIVTFIATLGGGTVTGAEQVTDDQGRARVGNWVLGPVPGNNRMIARSVNGLMATFNATGAQAPTTIEAASPQQQAGFVNFGVPVTPRVALRDHIGQGIQGLPVIFTRLTGDGTLQGDTAFTGTDGIAALGDWRLGSAASHTVRATVPGFPAGTPIEFEATAATRPFTIDVRFVSPVAASQRDVFIQAAMRWMEVITGDLPAFQANRGPNSCFGEGPAINELIDDLVIFASVAPIDGPGIILGRAGNCARRNGTNLPYLGLMTFDVADLPNYEATGRLEALILHEMGHVLGIGTLWDLKQLLQGGGGTDPTFSGAQALLAWPTLGLSYTGALVPVENDGGDGTRDAHWRESILDRELMTGYIESQGVTMPMSRLTVASLLDLGYQVNLDAADLFVAPGLRADGRTMMTPGKTRIMEILLLPEGQLMPDGTLIPHPR